MSGCLHLPVPVGPGQEGQGGLPCALGRGLPGADAASPAAWAALQGAGAQLQDARTRKEQLAAQVQEAQAMLAMDSGRLGPALALGARPGGEGVLTLHSSLSGRALTGTRSDPNRPEGGQGSREAPQWILPNSSPRATEEMEGTGRALERNRRVECGRDVGAGPVSAGGPRRVFLVGEHTVQCGWSRGLGEGLGAASDACLPRFAGSLWLRDKQAWTWGPQGLGQDPGTEESDPRGCRERGLS